MPRIRNGSAQSADQLQDAQAQLVRSATAAPLAFTAVKTAEASAFDFLFPGRIAPAHQLAGVTPSRVAGRSQYIRAPSMLTGGFSR
jgi:hypothetical protein